MSKFLVEFPLFWQNFPKIGNIASSGEFLRKVGILPKTVAICLAIAKKIEIFGALTRIVYIIMWICSVVFALVRAMYFKLIIILLH
jgi:hypothetical protein